MAQLIAIEKRILVLQSVVEKVLDILHIEPRPAMSPKADPAPAGREPSATEAPSLTTPHFAGKA